MISSALAMPRRVFRRSRGCVWPTVQLVVSATVLRLLAMVR